jgi:hypothetical protein
MSATEWRILNPDGSVMDDTGSIVRLWTRLALEKHRREQAFREQFLPPPCPPVTPWEIEDEIREKAMVLRRILEDKSCEERARIAVQLFR